MIAPLLLVVAMASQPPVPSAAKREGRPPQASTDQPQQQRQADARPPLPAAPQTSQKQPVTEGRAPNQKDEPPTDWWIVWLTGLLVIVGGLQVWSVIWQNRIMDKQTTIMREQREAAAASASAAADIVRLTEKQQAILEQQHAAIAEQGTVMRGQLAAAEIAADAAKTSADALRVVHRQWLDVGNWECSIGPLGNTNRMYAMLFVRVTNKSQLPLTVRTVRGYVNGRKGGYVWTNTLIGPQENATGEITHILNDDELASYEANKHRASFVVAGWIEYWDAFGDAQQQMVGARVVTGPGIGLQVQGLADLPRNLNRIAREQPWPLDEPDGE